MATVLSYPHFKINVIDNSIYNVPSVESLPIHRPIYFMKTQKGLPGVPTWCDQFTTAKKNFGAETFNMLNQDYFSPAAYFLLRTLPMNGAFICRVADDTAKAAFIIVEASVKYNATLPLYVIDNTGKRVAKTVAPTTTKGLEVTWSTRTTRTSAELAADTPLDSLQPRESTDGLTITYPMFVFVANSPGVWGNDVGFKLSYDPKDNDDTIVNAIKAVFYKLAPLQKLYGESTIDSFYDIFSSQSNSFVMKPNTINASSLQAVSMDKIIDNAYTSPNYTLPYKIIAYNSNFLTIGNRAAQYLQDTDFTLKVADIAARDAMIDDFKATPSAPNYKSQLVWVIDATDDPDNTIASGGAMYEWDTVTSAWKLYDPTDTNKEYGWMVNVLSGIDLGSNYYNELIINRTEVLEDVSITPSIMNAEAIHFLGAGTDGALDDISIEAQIREAMVSGFDQTIFNSPRYPYTHMFDVGYGMKTKKAMCDFLTIREDIKVYLSTQRITRVGIGSSGEDVEANVIINDKAVDMSTGIGLWSYAILARESVLKGTECCRATIFAQCGITTDNYNGGAGYVPATLWTAMKHAQYQNKDYMDQEPKGLPNSDTSVFKEYNWVPSTEDMKNLAWTNGLNYCQYYNMTQLHYAGVRSVYRYDTSVLVDDTFTDAIVYSKHAIGKSWAKFAGVSLEAAILQDRIKKDLESSLSYLFNGKYKINLIKVYQTDEEKKIGYIQHILIQLVAPNTSRVWEVDLACYREGYNVPVIA